MDKDVLYNALMLSPFKTKWGTCMLQSWIPGFNPDNPSNLAFPTCIALRRLSYEHYDQAIAIAGTLGEVTSIDTTNDTAQDPRFCVHLKIDEGWVISIDLEAEGGSAVPQQVLVDYDRLSIRCRACQIWKHRVANCKETQKRQMHGNRRQPQIHITQQQ